MKAFGSGFGFRVEGLGLAASGREPNLDGEGILLDLLLPLVNELGQD